jgi:hypothetical protein
VRLQRLAVFIDAVIHHRGNRKNNAWWRVFLFGQHVMNETPAQPSIAVLKRVPASL